MWMKREQRSEEGVLVSGNARVEDHRMRAIREVLEVSTVTLHDRAIMNCR